MPLTAEQITVIRSSLDPSGYKAGAEQIVAANQKLAASGETVVQTQTRTTRALVDNGGAFERLKRQIDPTYAAAQQFARTQDVLTRSVETGRATQEEANRLMLLAQQRFDGTGGAARGMAGSADKASLAMRSLGIQSFDVFSQLSSGAPVMTIFIQQGAQVAQVAAAQGVGFGSFAAGIRSAVGAINPYAAAAVLTVGAMTALGIAAEVSARRMEALQNNLRGTRADYAAMAATAEAAAKHLAATTSIGTSDARAATGVIAATPQFQGTQTQLEALVRTAEDMRITLGETLPDAARLLAKAMGDPAAAIQDMADRRLKGFNQQLADAARLQQQAGDKAGAFSTFLNAMRASTAGATENLTPFQQAVRDLELVFTRTGQSGQSFAAELGAPIIQAAADALTAIRQLIEAVIALKQNFADIVPQSLKDAITWINAHDPTRMTFNLLTSGGGSASALPPTHPSIAAPLQSAATRNGIDPLLLARLQASEGLFDPATGTWKTSSAGAVGPMQVKPDTFAGVARLNPTLGLTDVTDPTQNVTAGATLFAHLLRKYGDVSLAILAYHDGETRIDRVLAGGGTVSPSQDALDQARRVTSGYGGTGLQAAGPSAPLMPDLPVPPIPSGTTIPNAEGIANTDAVADARKLVTGLNLIADAQARIAAQRESLEAGLQAATLAGNQADIDRLTKGLAALSGEYYRAVSPQEEFIRGLETQARTAAIVTEGDRKIAQTLQQIAELDRQHPENATSSDQHARALNAVLAEQSGAYRVLSNDLDIQITAQRTLAAAYGQGYEAVARATAGTQAFEQALKLFPAGSAQFQAALAGLTEQFLALSRAQAEARIAQQTAANDNRITLIQTEAATLGMSNEARTVLLARLRAEQELKQQAIPIESALGLAYLASVDALTRETLAFDRHKAALDDIANSFSQSFDTIGNAITQSLLSGQGAAVNWRNVMTSVSQQVLQQFLKLTVLNPLLNSLFGGNRSTIGDVFNALNAGGGSGGSGSGAGMFGLLGQFGGLLGPSATALANLTGATATGLGASALTASTGILVGGVHSGGLIGTDPWTFTRAVPSNNFSGAPRYHSGLGADEFAAILQRGERVLTGNQNTRLATTLSGLTEQGETRQGQAPTIVFNIQTPDVDGFKRSQTQIYGQAAAALGRTQRKIGAR